MVKNMPANAGDARNMDLILRWGRSPGVGDGNPLQDSCLEIPWTEEPGRLVHGASKSRTRLSD